MLPATGDLADGDEALLAPLAREAALVAVPLDFSLVAVAVAGADAEGGRVLAVACQSVRHGGVALGCPQRLALCKKRLHRLSLLLLLLLLSCCYSGQGPAAGPGPLKFLICARPGRRNKFFRLIHAYSEASHRPLAAWCCQKLLAHTLPKPSHSSQVPSRVPTSIA